jgi:hypothetical protein
MAYVYVKSESNLWTVGHYDPGGDWIAESDHTVESNASERVAFLNGADTRGASLHRFWQRHAEWSQATFGSDAERGPIGPLKHLEKEAREAQAKPDDLEEYADCLFLVLDATRRAGYTLDDLIAASFAKLAVNRNRIWHKPTSDEPVEHVRETAVPQ